VNASNAAIIAALASAHALVASLEAALAALAEPGHERDVLDAKATMAGYGVGRDGLLAAAARGELELHRGPRNRVLVERVELERWLKSRPLLPPRRKPSEPEQSLDAWQEEQERELRALGGAAH
jgi:hypothetical protein